MKIPRHQRRQTILIFFFLFTSILSNYSNQRHSHSRILVDAFQIVQTIGTRHVKDAFSTRRQARWYTDTKMDMVPNEVVSSIIDHGSNVLLSMNQEEAEALAGPFFGASLFPYIAFIYLLNVEENDTPKGVTIGFASCLSFVFLTIPAAIIAKLWYGVSLADCDWLHGSAESLLTVTNLVTVLAFRQVLNFMEKEEEQRRAGGGQIDVESVMPSSATSYWPMALLLGVLTAAAGVTALVPGLAEGTGVHTPYLGGFMDLPLASWWGAQPEPDNALTVACWIIHTSSLVEFLVVMGFAWRYADVIQNPKWKGLTWGLLPLHTSGITACTYHLFYNRIPILVPLQAMLTCFGNSTAAFAAFRIAVSNGWAVPNFLSFLEGKTTDVGSLDDDDDDDDDDTSTEITQGETTSLVGFEDLGQALAGDTDYTFLIKLFLGCALASYVIKYGELWFQFPFDANLNLALGVIIIPSLLNAFKWYKRSEDPSFEGWF